MTVRLTKFFCASALVVWATTAGATQCTASKPSCELYLNHHGDLMRTASRDAPPTALFVGTGTGASAASEYVMRRADRYYLVREYADSAKSFDIVPLNVSEQSVDFDRVLRFSRIPKESAKSGVEVWVADEIDLPAPSAIETFSWDRAAQLFAKTTPSAAGEAGSALQQGFSAIPLTIHDAAGAVTGQRAYLYADKLGVTPESIVCAARCVVDTSAPTGTFRGGIGEYPVTLTLATLQDQIEGSYRYDGKRGVLKLKGSREGSAAITLVEHPAAHPAKVTGKIDALLTDGMYMGLWTPPSKGSQLPFFAVLDTL